MNAAPRNRAFLQSKSGQRFLLFLVICALLSAMVGYSFYASSLSWFEEHKRQEKSTALALVDAFVSNYSDLRAKFGPQAPVPATFRAHSIDLFNQQNQESGLANDFHLQWVGRKGRAIATPPADDAMARTIEGFAAERDPKARSQFLTIGGRLVFRTVYPSFAHQQSCVDCHNQLQPDQHWKLGDLMGAFVIDVPAQPFLGPSRRESIALGLAMFAAFGALGLVVGLFHFRQMAEREAAQIAVQSSEERFRDFAETASDWFWEQDEQLRFTYASQSSPGTISQLFGKTRAELRASGSHFGVPDEQAQAHEADLAARRPFQNYRFQRIGKNGEIIYSCISGKPVFDAAGRFRGYRGTGRDVTAEFAVERELARRVDERTAALQAAQSELLRKERLSTLGQLTATVAHELRNPLSAIRNSIFAIKEKLTGNAGLERPLARAERSVERCDRIISELLDFTRLRELRRSEVEADPWLEEVVREQRLPEGVELRLQLAAGCRIGIDPERMRRVVINLIENAAQALAEPGGDAGGRRITVASAASRDRFEFVIEDTGPGIAGDILPKVFEPLFSTKGFGTGLGLPTVKQIVEQHGGTVEIESEPGRGARVIVRLPLAAVGEMAA